MKTIITGLIFALLAITSVHASPISAREAARMVGSEVTIIAVVTEVKEFSSGRILLNLDGHFPNQALTLNIEPEFAAAFPDVYALEGRSILATGTVVEYKGRAEINLRSPAQLVAQ